MLRFLQSLRRWRSAETADTATSLWERFLPTPREIIVGVGTVLTSAGLGWWAAVQSALPFGVVAGIVAAVAFRVWWLNERGARAPAAVVVGPPEAHALPPPSPNGGQPRATRELLWIGHRTYVGRIEVDTNRLESDFMLEFAFIAFNGTPSPLRLAGLHCPLPVVWRAKPPPFVGAATSLKALAKTWDAMGRPFRRTCVRSDGLYAKRPFLSYW